MVRLWYIQYGEGAETVDPQTVVPAVQRIIKEKDESANLEEVRLLPLTIAFKVNHPNYKVVRINGKKRLVDIRTVNNPAFPVPLIVWIVVAVIGAAIAAWMYSELNKTIRAYLEYCIETIERPCPGDPACHEGECCLHLDAEGNPLVFPDKTSYLAHIASAHATAYQWMDDSGVLNRDLGEDKAWYEQILDILPVIIILIGAAIVVPLIIKVIPTGGK